MRDPVLTHECICMHRYLVGGVPSAYVVDKYEAAHRHLLALATTRNWFDAFLVRSARSHSLLLRLIQVYARIFAPAALVRKKAVLLLAVIECGAPSLVTIQAARPRSPGRAIAGSILTVVAFALELLLAVIVFAPIHAVSGLAGKVGRMRAVRAPVVEGAT
jgi:hypothetical protein